MSDQFYIRFRGRVQGPFTEAHLQKLSTRGQFGRMHEVSTDGKNWARATEHPTLMENEFAAEAYQPAEEPAPEYSLPGAPPTPPPASGEWHYYHAGQQQGPVAISYIRYLLESGEIDADTLVWKAGMADWEAASTIPSLRPAAPTPAPAPAPVYMHAPMQHHPGEIYPRVSGLAVASLVLGLLWLWGIGSILAIIFGATALHQIRIGKGLITGTGLAVAGLVLGVVFIGIELIYILPIIIHDDPYYWM